VEWLHARVVRGSQKALTIKNGVESQHDHAEPLDEELRLAIITRALWNSVTQFLDERDRRSVLQARDSNANGWNMWLSVSIEYLASFWWQTVRRQHQVLWMKPVKSATVQAAVTSHVMRLERTAVWPRALLLLLFLLIFKLLWAVCWTWSQRGN